MLKSKDLLGLYYLSAEEIYEILNGAFAEKKFLNGGYRKSDDLAGRSLITLFYENTTRTRWEKTNSSVLKNSYWTRGSSLNCRSSSARSIQAPPWLRWDEYTTILPRMQRKS